MWMWAYLVRRNPLGLTGWTNNEVNVCHVFVIEHECISTKI